MATPLDTLRTYIEKYGKKVGEFVPASKVYDRLCAFHALLLRTDLPAARKTIPPDLVQTVSARVLKDCRGSDTLKTYCERWQVEQLLDTITAQADEIRLLKMLNP